VGNLKMDCGMYVCMQAHVCMNMCVCVQINFELIALNCYIIDMVTECLQKLTDGLMVINIIL
jgi:hypothetical protein